MGSAPFYKGNCLNICLAKGVRLEVSAVGSPSPCLRLISPSLSPSPQPECHSPHSQSPSPSVFHSSVCLTPGSTISSFPFHLSLMLILSFFCSKPLFSITPSASLFGGPRGKLDEKLWRAGCGPWAIAQTHTAALQSHIIGKSNQMQQSSREQHGYPGHSRRTIVAYFESPMRKAIYPWQIINSKVIIKSSLKDFNSARVSCCGLLHLLHISTHEMPRQELGAQWALELKWKIQQIHY